MSTKKKKAINHHFINEQHNIQNEIEVIEMLKYKGPSFRQKTPPSDSIYITDIISSDENEKTVDRLLSSRSIPFFIERPQLGWKDIYYRMTIAAPKNRYQQVSDILYAAVKAKVLKSPEGMEGLTYY